jgi:hypothetical protein
MQDLHCSGGHQHSHPGLQEKSDDSFGGSASGAESLEHSQGMPQELVGCQSEGARILKPLPLRSASSALAALPLRLPSWHYADGNSAAHSAPSDAEAQQQQQQQQDGEQAVPSTKQQQTPSLLSAAWTGAGRLPGAGGPNWTPFADVAASLKQNVQAALPYRDCSPGPADMEASPAMHAAMVPRRSHAALAEPARCQ